MNIKFNVKQFVLAPLVLAIVIFLWFVPTSFFGISELTVIQQRTIAIFCYAAMMWMFEIIPAWATSVSTIVMLPILAVVGSAMKDSLAQFGGVTTLLVCVASATSLAMLFPISTPPNAIASSTGLIDTHDMTKVGLLIGAIGLFFAYAILLVFPF